MRVSASFVPVFGLTLLIGSPALAQIRADLPDRIATGEPFGGSDFAESLAELSAQGKLDPQPVHPPDWRDFWDWRHHRHHRHHKIWRFPYWRHGYDYYIYDPYPFGIDGRVTYGYQPGSRLYWPGSGQRTYRGGSQPAQQQQQQQPDPEPLTTIEKARLALSEGRADESVRHYRAYLDAEGNQDDFGVMAELAAALIADDRMDDGVAMMRMAYESDPGLAMRPMTDRVVIPDQRLRDLVVRAVKHAHKRETPSAWLTVAVLMQAEGRERVGLRMLERAEDLGLAASVKDPLAAAMR